MKSQWKIEAELAADGAEELSCVADANLAAANADDREELEWAAWRAEQRARQLAVIAAGAE